jgi:hypothetical protein
MSQALSIVFPWTWAIGYRPSLFPEENARESQSSRSGGIGPPFPCAAIEKSQALSIVFPWTWAIGYRPSLRGEEGARSEGLSLGD